jgi:acetylxylan esterase
MLGRLRPSETAVAALAVSASLLHTAAASLSIRQDECSDVHIFIAKGNNETEPGRQGKLVDAICSDLDSCTYEDIHFDNAYEVEFCSALDAGARNGRAQLEDFGDRCPESMIVVSGYSQGAHVMGDILGGGSGMFFQNCTQTPNGPLDPNTKPGNMSRSQA